MAAKFSFTGSFSVLNAGVKTLLVLPAPTTGTLAISNNSSTSFTVLLDGTPTIVVQPFGIARIGITGLRRLSIRARAAANGSFIFQQS